MASPATFYPKLCSRFHDVIFLKEIETMDLRKYKTGAVVLQGDGWSEEGVRAVIIL